MKQDFNPLQDFIGSEISLNNPQQQPFISLHQDAHDSAMVLNIGTNSIRIRLSCPHMQDNVKPLPENGLNIEEPCAACETHEEIFVCLNCFKAHCREFDHMVDHRVATGHIITMSYSDANVWCYECQAYIVSNAAMPHQNFVSNLLFGTDLEDNELRFRAGFTLT